jgi:hypothetical protein
LLFQVCHAECLMLVLVPYIQGPILAKERNGAIVSQKQCFFKHQLHGLTIRRSCMNPHSVQARLEHDSVMEVMD